MIKQELKKIRTLLHRRFYLSKSGEKDIVEKFHKFFYDAYLFESGWQNVKWMGETIMKCPFDLIVYQEIIFEKQPNIIIETGTQYGGSALFMANICDLIGRGEVITVDKKVWGNPKKHDRITHLNGSSTDPDIFKTISSKIKPGDSVMVVLDSDHTEKHVLKELELYAPLVTRNQYCIVEDTNINGHPVEPDFGAGPHEAVTKFLKTTNEFHIDKEREKFFVTFNPDGYLLKR